MLKKKTTGSSLNCAHAQCVYHKHVLQAQSIVASRGSSEELKAALVITAISFVFLLNSRLFLFS